MLNNAHFLCAHLLFLAGLRWRVLVQFRPVLMIYPESLSRVLYSF